MSKPTRTRRKILVHLLRMALRGKHAAAMVLLLLASSGASEGSPGIDMGTTILAARYKGGVVVGAETRTSVSGYVSNRYASKLTFVLDASAGASTSASTIGSGAGDEEASGRGGTGRGSTCCLCRSGSAADTQHLASLVTDELVARSLLQHGRAPTVSNAAHLVRSLVNENPNWQCSVLCAGYDHASGRGRIYSVSPGGAMVEHDEADAVAMGGSGSTYVTAYVDEFRRSRRLLGRGDDGGPSEMEEGECVDFVGGAIELAMSRDGSSGGFVRLFVIGEGGKREIIRMPRGQSGADADGGADGGQSLDGFAPPASAIREGPRRPS